jgi:hypothetical protein
MGMRTITRKVTITPARSGSGMMGGQMGPDRMSAEGIRTSDLRSAGAVRSKGMEPRQKTQFVIMFEDSLLA